MLKYTYTCSHMHAWIPHRHTHMHACVMHAYTHIEIKIMVALFIKRKWTLSSLFRISILMFSSNQKAYGNASLKSHLLIN